MDVFQIDSNLISRYPKEYQAYRNAVEKLKSDRKPKKNEAAEALCMAIWVGDLTAVDVLLTRIPYISEYIMMMAAAPTANPKVFELFLEHGWDINQTFGFNPMPALNFVLESKECVQWFLEHGADPNMKTPRYKISPLTFAANYPSTEVIDMLFAGGAEPDTNAIHSALGCGSKGGIEMVKWR